MVRFSVGEPTPVIRAPWRCRLSIHLFMLGSGTRSVLQELARGVRG